jgi:hypothetical protein
MLTHVVWIGLPHLLSSVCERPCVVHNSGRRTCRLPAGVALGRASHQRVDNATSLLVLEFVQYGTNEGTQLGSRHRLEGPAEIRVSRSNTGRARSPTGHLFGSLRRVRQSCQLHLRAGNRIVAGGPPGSEILSPRGMRATGGVVGVASGHVRCGEKMRSFAMASAIGRRPRSRASRPDRSWSP